MISNFLHPSYYNFPIQLIQSEGAGYDADGFVVGMVVVEELFIGVGPVEYLDLLVWQ